MLSGMKLVNFKIPKSIIFVQFSEKIKEIEEKLEMYHLKML